MEEVKDMKDMCGNKVVDGDFMFESHGDYAYLFEVKNNRPVMFAMIDDDKIEKFDMESIEEAINAFNSNCDVPTFTKNYFVKVQERIGNLTIDSLMKLSDETIMDKILEYKAVK